MTSCSRFIATLLLPSAFIASFLRADSTSPTAGVIAQVGPVSITEDQMKNDAGFALGVYQLENSIYEKKRAWADRKVRETLFELGAKDAKMSVAKFRQKEIDKAVTAPTKEEIDAQVKVMSQQLSARGQTVTDPKTLEEIRKQAESIVTQQKRQMREQTVFTELAKKYPISTTLMPPAAPAVKIPYNADDPVRGPATAKVTIVEFTDIQCPFCKRSQDTVHQILAAYPKDVKLVGKEYPLPFHNRAKPAAEAALCANLQGKFWEFRDKAFAGSPKLEDADLESYAKEAGLDLKKFNQCVKSHQTASRVEQDLAEGQALGVQGTPHFFINNRVVNGAQPYEAFKSAIDQELAIAK